MSQRHSSFFTNLISTKSRRVRTSRLPSLLLRGDDVVAAAAWVTNRRPDAPAISDAMQAFIAASKEADAAFLLKANAAEQRIARSRRLVAVVAATFVTVLTVGLVSWIEQPFIKEQGLWWRSQRWFVSANIWPYVLRPQVEQALKPGDNFRECAPRQQKADYCPDMVVVPAGTFKMGSLQTDKNAHTNELPQHQVSIAKPFAVSKFELTFAEWDACVAGGGCSGYKPFDSGWGRGERPAINVSWDDAQQYVAWLSQMTGKPYRLLAEAEYEYATRAETTTEYPWGDEIGKNNANCGNCGSKWDGQQTAPVGSFQANKFGLYDMVGNVWEWTEDCYHPSYAIDTPQGKVDAPTDGSAWTSGNCGNRVVRGGSWYFTPDLLRSAARDRNSTDYRIYLLGFRVARTLLAP